MKIYKLPFGNRGHNQPVIEHSSQRCFITSQNHGYAIDSKSIPCNWKETFINANDSSNEGISNDNKQIVGYQWHPESSGGPKDTEFLFDRFLNKCKNGI